MFDEFCGLQMVATAPLQWDLSSNVRQISANIEATIASIMALGCLLLAIFQKSWLCKNQQTPDGRNTKKHRFIEATLLYLLIVATGFNYFYLSRSHGSWLHRWDIYHTVISSRYLNELGYNKLYECTIVLDRHAENRLAQAKKIRDLSTYKIRRISSVVKNSDCLQRFNSTRKQEFLDDFYTLHDMGLRGYRFLRDKGYNGTPVYSRLVSWLVGSKPLSRSWLNKLALLDVGLIIAAFFAVIRSFGLRTGAIATVFFFTNFPNRFVHMGGSILRFDYLVCLVFAACAFRRERFALAGILLALATVERIFPLLFALGIAIYAIAPCWRARSILPPYRHFMIAFCLTCIAAIIASLSLERGWENWSLWYDNISLHAQRSAYFRIGYKHLWMIQSDIMDPSNWASYHDKARQLHQLRWPYWASVLLVMTPLVAAHRRLDATSFVLFFGCFAFFLVFVATRYYYSLTVLLVLAIGNRNSEQQPWFMLALLFGISSTCYFQFLDGQFSGFLYNYLYTGLMTLWFLCMLIWIWNNDCTPNKPSKVNSCETPILPSIRPSGSGTEV